jgi:hypothetical protein
LITKMQLIADLFFVIQRLPENSKQETISCT